MVLFVLRGGTSESLERLQWMGQSKMAGAKQLRVAEAVEYPRCVLLKAIPGKLLSEFASGESVYLVQCRE